MTGGTDEPGTLIVGREAELRRLAAWQDAAETDGAVLCIVGEAGVGKTALLDFVCEGARRRGAHVFRVVGEQFPEQVSLTHLDRMLETLRHRFVELPSGAATALSVALGMSDGPPPTELHLYNAVLLLLRHVARERPLVILVDDAHWIDPASFAALTFLARRVAGYPIGFLMTVRAGHEADLERCALDALDLLPLDDVSATRLIATQHPMIPARVLRRLIAEAQGNPLALVELPASLTRDQRGGHAELPPVLPAGPRLGAMFAERISALSAPAREALLLAALRDGHDDGAGEGGVLLASVSHRLPGNVPFTLPVEAVRAGLVSSDSSRGRVTFRHPLVRSAVVELATDLERRRAHRTLAHLAPAGSMGRAWHRAQATVAPDEAVAVELDAAAQRSLRRGDARGALRALSRAAELTPDPTERRRRSASATCLAADVTGDLGYAPTLVGRDESVRNTHGRGFADTHQRRTRAPLAASVAEAHILLNKDGNLVAAHRLLVGAISLTLSDPAPGDIADRDHDIGEALHLLMLVCFFIGSAEMWAPFEAALARLGSRVPALLSLSAATFCDPARGAAEALSTLDARVDHLYLQTEPSSIVRTARATFYVDRVAGCRESLARVAADGRAGGAVASGVDAVTGLGFDALVTGDWVRAERLLREGAETSDRGGYLLLSWPAHFGLSLLAAARGDHEVVERLTADMMAWARPRSAATVEVYAHHARALAALSAGDPATAFTEAAAISPPGNFRPHVAHALWVMLDLVEAAVALGRLDDARSHVSAMRALGIGDLSPRYESITATCAALVADPPQATLLFEAALSVPGADRWSFDTARTHLLYGRHLRRERDVPSARHQLRAASEIFSRLGADPWWFRAADELRAAGQSLRAQSGLPRKAWLTPHQVRVAELAASGLTNKQIAGICHVSHRAVGSVLYQVFRAVGVSSRADLAEALRNTEINTGVSSSAQVKVPMRGTSVPATLEDA